MTEFPNEIWAAKEGQFGQGVDPIKLAPWTETRIYEGSQRYIKANDANGWKPDAPDKIYKRAMIGARQMKGYKTKQNWVLAMDLFIVGSTYAYEICHYAGIAPEGYEVEW